MVTIKAGSTNYAVAISVGKTGAAGSELPDGNTVYLYAEKVKVSFKSTDKRKILSLGKQKKIITGKSDCNVNVVNCTVDHQVQAKATLEVNEIIDYFDNWGFKQGSDSVYLWVYNIGDSEYLELAIDSTGTQKRYMEGVIGNYAIEMGKGKLFKIPMLLFQQVN